MWNVECGMLPHGPNTNTILVARPVCAAAIGGGQGAKRLRGERACAEHEHEERCPCADAVRERGTTSVQVSRMGWRASG